MAGKKYITVSLRRNEGKIEKTGGCPLISAGSLQKKVREWRGKLKNLAGASGKRPKAALSRYRNAGSTENTSGATRRSGSLWDFAAEARQIFHGRQACVLCNGSIYFL